MPLTGPKSVCVSQFSQPSKFKQGSAVIAFDRSSCFQTSFKIHPSSNSRNVLVEEAYQLMLSLCSGTLCELHITQHRATRSALAELRGLHMPLPCLHLRAPHAMLSLALWQPFSVTKNIQPIPESTLLWRHSLYLGGSAIQPDLSCLWISL